MAITAYTGDYFDDINTQGVDDLSPNDKNYLRVLFRPGRTVQTRELNQAQSILQTQVDRLGQGLFKSNSPILGGEGVFDRSLQYIDVVLSYDYATTIENWAGDYATKTIKQDNKTLVATIASIEILSDNLTDDRPNKEYRIFIHYTSGDVLGGLNQDIFDETSISIYDDLSSIGMSGTVNASGFAVGTTLNTGLHYTKGSVVTAKKQFKHIPLIGEQVLFTGYAVLRVTENVITSESDKTLLDNANGTYNYAAPGADRYQVALELDLVTNEEYAALIDAVIILQIVDSNVVAKADSLDNNSSLEKILAQRTFEESGNYVTKPFSTSVEELWGATDYKGRYNNSDDLLTAIGSTDFNLTEAEKKFALSLSPSVAYVKGNRVELPETLTLIGNKARTKWGDLNTSNYSTGITANVGTYVEGNMSGGVPIIPSTNAAVYNLMDASSPAVVIGTTRIQTIEYLSDATVDNQIKCRLYLYNIALNAGELFANAVSITSAAGTYDQGLMLFDITAVSNQKLHDTSVESSLFKLPNSPISSVSRLEITRKVTLESVVISDDSPRDLVTLTDDLGGIIDASKSNLIVLRKDVSSPEEYTFVMNDEYEVSGNGSSITLSFDDSSADWGVAGDIIIVIASARYNATSALGLKKKTQVTNAAINYDSPLTSYNIGDVLTLSGVYHLISVDDGNWEVTTDGQGADEYKQATVTCLKDGVNEIVYTHWDFIDNGAFFTVDSYVDGSLAKVPIKDVPSYDNKRLSDRIDIRVPNNGTRARIALDPYSSISTEINFFLPRQDVLTVNSASEFAIIQGTPDVNPEFPLIPNDAMPLVNIDVPAYTFNTADITTSIINNRRYTMRDIGRIDNRVGTLEYYTTLSLLEKSVADETIYDDSGQARFKNGFIVDSFRNHSVGDVSSSDYYCSVDRNRGLLYPYHNGSIVPLKTSNVGSIEAGVEFTNSGVSQTSLSLPYKEVEYVSQPLATEFISVQPHENVATIGSLQLHPEVDMWSDRTTQPSVEIDLFGELSTTLNQIIESTNIVGTEWDSWVETERLSRRTRRQGRDGVSTSVVQDQIQENLGEFVTDVKLKPYMRSRIIWIHASGLKPNARFYGFFDGVDVTDYIFGYSGTENTLEIDLSLDEGLDESSLLTRYTTNRSDVSAELTSDKNGTASGFFIVPNNENIKFGVGEKILKLTNSPRNIKTETTSTALSRFIANGMDVVGGSIEISTSLPRIQREFATESRIIRRRRRDPIAQSFRVSDSTGIFLSSTEVYFAAKPTVSNSAPVQLYLVSMENGQPTENVVPGSEVWINQEDVSVSADSSEGTKFNFNKPIYLHGGDEYALVVFSTSKDYLIYVAEMGGDKNDLLTNQIVSFQPAVGVMFTSANKSTWSAYQNRDVKFILNRSSFQTGSHSISCDAVLPSTVESTTVTAGGSGYTTTAEVAFGVPTLLDPITGGLVTIDGGVAAEGIVILEDGVVIEIQITKKGFGYVSPPLVTIDPGVSGEGGGATATADLKRIGVSSFNLNQKVITISKDTSITNKVALGQSNDYNVTPGRPFESITQNAYTIVPGNAHETQLSITLTSSDDRVTPAVDRDSLSLEVRSYHIAGEAEDESLTSRYLTRQIPLSNPADQLDVYLSVNRPTINSDVKLYAKTFDAEGEEIGGWVAVEAISPRVTPINSSREDYAEVRYQLDQDGIEFSSFIIKIVFLGEGHVDIPTVKDMRTIASI